MTTTMAEVARRAGVSITTVSHVLNRTRRVNQETRERVLRAIEETGYEPHSIARALAGAKTRSLGLAISGISNPYFMDVVAAIERQASDSGYTLLFGDTHEDPAKELEVLRELARRRVDGLLLAPAPSNDLASIDYVRTRGVPTVLVDRTLPVELDQVGPENIQATKQLTAHLIELGHSRIGFVGGLPGLSTTSERIAGYEAALETSGVVHDPLLLRTGRSSRDPARRATHDLLDLPRPPTAIIAANNAMTIGVLSALREREMAVPRDLALVSFDDLEWSDLFEPHLTVIAQPTEAIGRTAVEMLLARLADPDRPVETCQLPTRFVHRSSCGCAP